jgi:hypothetical protein
MRRWPPLPPEGPTGIGCWSLLVGSSSADIDYPLNLAKFYWAYRTFGLEADIDCFCVYYDLWVAESTEAYSMVRWRMHNFPGAPSFRCHTCMGKRYMVQISYAQRNWWSNNWYRHWFYIGVTRVSFKDENNNDCFMYPLASKMKNLIPYSRVATEKSLERRVCEKAFELSVYFSIPMI